jgi:hypothetical protein
MSWAIGGRSSKTARDSGDMFAPPQPLPAFEYPVGQRGEDILIVWDFQVRGPRHPRAPALVVFCSDSSSSSSIGGRRPAQLP